MIFVRIFAARQEKDAPFGYILGRPVKLEMAHINSPYFGIGQLFADMRAYYGTDGIYCRGP